MTWSPYEENLTGSRFVSPCDGGSPRREIELGAQQCPRKWKRASELSRHAGCHTAGGQNFIIEPANSAGIHSRAKSAARNAGAKGGDSFPASYTFDSFKIVDVTVNGSRELLIRKLKFIFRNPISSRPEISAANYEIIKFCNN